MAVNIAAVLWSSQVFVFCFFPVTYPITSDSLANMNWIVVIFFGVTFFSMGFYVWHGRKHYTGPVVFVDGVAGEGHGLVLQTVGETEIETFAEK